MNPTSIDSYPAYVTRLYERIDLIVILLFFLGILWITQDYTEIARLFPNVIFGLGVIFAVVELVANVLPAPYREQYHRIFSGLTDDFDIEAELEAEIEGETDLQKPAEERERRRRFVIISSLLLGFYVVAYLIGFIFTVPLFVFIGLYLMGFKDYRAMLILAVFLVVVVYGLFGVLMNVPITEGVLVDI